MMRKLITIGIGLMLCLATRGASAGAVADYRDDFQSATPKTGWSYWWNPTAPLVFEVAPGSGIFMMTPNALVQLGADGTNYETVVNGTRPDAAPGSNLAATATSLIPGQGSGQTSDDVEHYVLAAYTIQPGDVAANGNQLILDGYSFNVPLTSEDGVTAKVFKNNILYIDRALPPGLDFNVGTPAPNGGPIPLGEFNAGDTLYVAIGANGAALVGEGNDINDILSVDYTIVLVPEPAGAATAVGLASLMFLRRRRSAATGTVRVTM
jgi:hypothetical protein